MGTPATSDSGRVHIDADPDAVQSPRPDFDLEVRQAHTESAADPIQRGLKAFEKVGADNKLNLSVEQMATLKVLETALLKGDLDTMAATIKKLNENTKSAYPLLQAFRDDLFAAGLSNSVSGSYSMGLQLNIFRPLSSGGADDFDRPGHLPGQTSGYKQIFSIDKNGIVTVGAYKNRDPDPDSDADDLADQDNFQALQSEQRRLNPHSQFKSIAEDANYYLQNHKHR